MKKKWKVVLLSTFFLCYITQLQAQKKLSKTNAAFLYRETNYCILEVDHTSEDRAVVLNVWMKSAKKSETRHTADMEFSFYSDTRERSPFYKVRLDTIVNLVSDYYFVQLKFPSSIKNSYVKFTAQVSGVAYLHKYLGKPEVSSKIENLEPGIGFTEKENRFEEAVRYEVNWSYPKAAYIEDDDVEFNVSKNRKGRLFYFNKTAHLKVDDDFPKIKNPVSLMEPLRYISKNEEFSSMKESDDPKKSLDNFWKARNENLSQARLLIKTFYKKVKLANVFFTELQEGWKTDRGMIYILFGKPDLVFIFDDKEEWYYTTGEDKIGFLFEKIEFESGMYDFFLERNKNYKTVWYKAVAVWRNGDVDKIIKQ